MTIYKVSIQDEFFLQNLVGELNFVFFKNIRRKADSNLVISKNEISNKKVLLKL